MTESHKQYNKREIGGIQEQKAAEYLERLGFHILERNYRCRTGEIDIIAKDGRYLCFVEVKFRSGKGCGYPQEAVTPYKQGKIFKTALYYMLCKKLPEETPCRFDVVVILNETIEIIKDAFNASY